MRLVRPRRLVYISQDWVEAEAHPRLYRAERALCRRADLVVWNQEDRARRAQAEYGLATTPLVVPTYLPRAFPVPQRDEALRGDLLRQGGITPENAGRAILIFAGGPFVPARMSPEVVGALEAIPDPVVVVFTGDRPAEASTSPLAARLVFLGRLPYERMFDIGAACDIGLLLYPTEAFGHRYQQPGRLTEYLRVGLSCVASPFPDAVRIERASGIIQTVDPYDPAAIAAGLRVLIARIRTDPGHGAKTRGYAERNLTYDPGGQVLRDAIDDVSR